MRVKFRLKKTRKERVKYALARIGVKNALRVFLSRPSWSPRLAGGQVRGFGFWYQLALDKRFLLAHDTPSIAHPLVAGWVFAFFLVLLSCAGGAGARCAASSLSLSSGA